MQPGFNNPQANAGPPAELLGFIVLFYGGLFLFGLVLFVMQIITLVAAMNCLSAVSPRNRQMEPGMVWLTLVPLLGIVWIFLTVTKVAGSLRDEYEDRDLRGDDDYGQTVGLVYAISAIVCGCIAPIPLFLYRQKLVGYTRELEDAPASRRRRRPRRDRDDRDDDRGYDDRDDDR